MTLRIWIQDECLHLCTMLLLLLPGECLHPCILVSACSG